MSREGAQIRINPMRLSQGAPLTDWLVALSHDSPFGPQPAAQIATLVEALRSKVDIVRFHAAISLGDLGSDGRPASAALIHTSLWDTDAAVRVEAAMAVWKIDGKLPLVLQVLVKALDDDNELICWIAAERLAQLGSVAGEAIPALRQALHRDFRISLVKKAILLALERIDPQGGDHEESEGSPSQK
jgi:HEAT repeat protein